MVLSDAYHEVRRISVSLANGAPATEGEVKFLRENVLLRQSSTWAARLRGAAHHGVRRLCHGIRLDVDPEKLLDDELLVASCVKRFIAERQDG